MCEQPDKAGTRVMSAVKSLQVLVLKHVGEEEDQIFQALHARLSAKDNAALTVLLHKEGRKLA